MCVLAYSVSCYICGVVGSGSELPSRGTRRRRSDEVPSLMSAGVSVPFGQPLSNLVEQATHPLRGWDVDFIIVEISPASIPCFSPWWTVGGSAKRSVSGNRVDPFPEGLEVANEPFTLRAQPPEGLTQEQVAAWGNRLLQILKQQSPTGNPCLVPPLDIEVAAKQLSVDARMCSGTALARALGHPSLRGFKLFVARYGMKVAAQDFFENHLMPAMDAMADEIGEEEAMERFHNMTVDWATQSPLSGRVLLLAPLPQAAKQLSWPAKFFSYPMFGRVAGGAGGLTIVSKTTEPPLWGSSMLQRSICMLLGGSTTLRVWASHRSLYLPMPPMGG